MKTTIKVIVLFCLIFGCAAYGARAFAQVHQVWGSTPIQAFGQNTTITPDSFVTAGAPQLSLQGTSVDYCGEYYEKAAKAGFFYEELSPKGISRDSYQSVATESIMFSTLYLACKLRYKDVN